MKLLKNKQSAFIIDFEVWEFDKEIRFMSFDLKNKINESIFFCGKSAVLCEHFVLGFGEQLPTYEYLITSESENAYVSGKKQTGKSIENLFAATNGYFSGEWIDFL